MKQNQADRVFLSLSICGFLLVSVSFLLMPVDAVGFLPGLLFWGGLVVGVIFQIVLEARRRAFFAKYNVKREKMQKPRNGLLTFGSNLPARIADYAFLAGLIATVIAFIVTKGTGYVCYIGISIVFLSFCLHCILNGRNFFYVQNQKKIRHALEQMKANSTDKGEGENGKK